MKPQPKLLGLQSLSSLPIDSLAALVSSIICISLTPIFIRLSELEIGPNATVFNRFWIAAVAFGIVSALLTARNGQNYTQSTQHKPHPVGTLHATSLLIVDGVLLSTGMIFWAWSLTKTSIADSSIMHNLVPIFTVLGGWLALGQTFDRRFVFGMFVALIGSLLLEINDLLSLSISQQLLGNLAALLSAVFLGIHPLIIEQLRINLNSVTIMTWSSITSALLLLPVALITEGQIFPSSLTGWFSVIALAFFGQILGVGLWAYCLKKLSAGFGSLVALLIPALSAVEGWAILSENIELWTLASFLVILFGMYLAISSRSAIKSGV